MQHCPGRVSFSVTVVVAWARRQRPAGWPAARTAVIASTGTRCRRRPGWIRSRDAATTAGRLAGSDRRSRQTPRRSLLQWCRAGTRRPRPVSVAGSSARQSIELGECPPLHAAAAMAAAIRLVPASATAPRPATAVAVTAVTSVGVPWPAARPRRWTSRQDPGLVPPVQRQRRAWLSGGGGHGRAARHGPLPERESLYAWQSTKGAQARGREGMSGVGSGGAAGRRGGEGEAWDGRVGTRAPSEYDQSAGCICSRPSSLTSTRSSQTPDARKASLAPLHNVSSPWRAPPPLRLALITFILLVTQSSGVPWEPRLAWARSPVAGPTRRRAAALQPSRPSPGR